MVVISSIVAKLLIQSEADDPSNGAARHTGILLIINFLVDRNIVIDLLTKLSNNCDVKYYV